MDDTIDQMNKSAQAIVSFELDEIRPEMRELGSTIVDAAGFLRVAVPLLSEIAANADKTARTPAFKISRLEEQADEIYARGRKLLFQKTRHGDAMEFIRRVRYTHISIRWSTISTMSPTRSRALW